MSGRIYVIIFLCILLLCEVVHAHADTPPLIIAGDKNYPPYEFVDENGRYVGINADIMNALEKEMGVTIDFKPMDREDAQSALKNGEIDAMTMFSAEGQEDYAFSTSLEMTFSKIFVLEYTRNIYNIEDLEGRKVAVLKESPAFEILKKHPGIIVVEVADREEAIKKVVTKKVDAWVEDEVTGNYLLHKKKYENIKMVGDKTTESSYCISVRSDNKELLNKFDSAIKAIKRSGVQ